MFATFLQWWRGVPRRLIGLWRRSLQFRTMVLTFGLSGLAILLIGGYISFSVSSNLFQAQLDRVLAVSNSASTAAQRVLNSTDAADRGSLQRVVDGALRGVQGTTGSSAIALMRLPEEKYSAIAPQGRQAPSLNGVITDDLRKKVAANPEGQFWQSVALPVAAGEANPGVIVGSQISVPGAGRYELYVGYSFQPAAQTLQFIQWTGVLGASGLLLLLGLVTLVVVRLVIGPIQAAARTSRRLADGNLEVRLHARGEDELATLASSFNGMADSLQARIKELAELSNMQQRFVSDVSHELRTPLTTIRLASDMLHGARDTFSDQNSRTVELLHTQTERFQDLLADLLEISRYDAGSVELMREPTNLVNLVGDVMESMHGLAVGRGSELRLEAPGGYFDANVDPRRIRRIVRNLLGNAIEHGEGNPIVLAVDSNQSAVALSVRDYGMGMSAEDAAHVFDRFWRADPSRVRTIGGTGLGLAIALEDATAHGGQLEVWSLENVGTVFRLTLPRHVGQPIVDSPLPLVPSDPRASAPGRFASSDGNDTAEVPGVR